jgi:hypothetical protein
MTTGDSIAIAVCIAVTVDVEDSQAFPLKRTNNRMRPS